MKILNRLNRLFLAFFLLALGACEKREKLTVSTFAFRVTPSAAAVEPNGTVSLAVAGPGAENTVWSVSPTTAGVIAPEIGASVTFTAGANIGQANILATLGDAIARTQIGVVDYVGNPYQATKFDVYTDQGLPPPPLVSDIDVGGLTIEEISTEFSPEGLKFLRSSATAVGNFWDVTVDDNASGKFKDLSNFDNGVTPTASIKFFIRLHRALMGDQLVVEFKDTTPNTAFRNSNANWTGFNNALVNDWQEVTVLIGNFGGVNAVNFAQIEVPFSLRLAILNGANGPLTFDIDGVRWEQ